MDIVRITRRAAASAAPQGADAASVDITHIAQIYFCVGARFGLDRLRGAGATIAADTPWQKAAVALVVDDLFAYQSTLASRVIAEERDAPEGSDRFELWLAKRLRIVERVDQTLADLRSSPTVDLAMLTVATRQLRTLVES
jgi:glutamate dehydrogenase